MRTLERWRQPGPLVYPRPRTIVIQRGDKDVSDTLARLRHGVLAVDTETTDLPWWRSLVGSINLAAGDTAAFFYRDALPIAARWLSDQVQMGRTLVFHHAKFDMHQLRESFGLHIPYPVHDTMTMSFLLDNRGAGLFDARYRGHGMQKAHGLKVLAKWLLDPDAEDHEKRLMQQIRQRGGKHKGDWLLADEREYAEYSAMDAWYTLQLYLMFKEQIDGWENPDGPWDTLAQCYDTERWLCLAFRDMEERGVRADVGFFERWRKIINKRKHRAESRLLRIAGRRVNWNSPPQLRSLLYRDRKHGGLGIVPTVFTKGGVNSPSVPSANRMALLLCGHEIAPALMDYRKYDKEESTYGRALLGSVAGDGAIHPTFWQNGAVTNRTSCSDPNLQQQKRPEPGQKHSIREGFIPRNGLVLRFADYNQLEMRIAAHYADEQTFIQGYLKDGANFDAHSATGQRMYGKTAKTLEKEERNDGKIMNFLKLFGGGPKKAAEQLRIFMHDQPTAVFRALKKWGYYLQPGEDPYVALGYLISNKFNQMMPAIKNATYKETAIAEGRGFVMTAYGHHRYMESDKVHAAFNTKVQGTAGSLAKKGLVACYRELQLNRGEIALLLLIHDEIVYESEGDVRTDRRVLELMQELKRFKVPIIADMSGSNRSWHHKEKVIL